MLWTAADIRRRPTLHVADRGKLYSGEYVAERRRAEGLVTVVDSLFARIRICKVPPTESLEGWNLRPFHFGEGQVWDVDRRLADILIAWGYAQAAQHDDDQTQPANISRSRRLM